jgi:hypothetical protein
MQIDLHDADRQRVCTVQVDPASPPGVVHGKSGEEEVREYFLDWDRAFDDEGHLRKCPVCGCTDLFRRRRMTPVTGFIAVLVVTAIALVLWGIGRPPIIAVAAVLGFVVLGNLAIYLLAPHQLVCYRCHSVFSGLPVNEKYPEWSDTAAEPYQRAACDDRTGDEPT